MSELIAKLGIDWKLLIAQAVNFGILVYILKRFVYTPVITTLEKRRQNIADTMSKAEEADRRLTEIESEKQKVLAEARGQAKEIVSKAEAMSKKQAEEAIALAEQKAAAIKAEGEISLERERSRISSEVKKEIGSVVAAAVEKTVGDFLDKKAEERLKAEALAIIKENAETFR